MEQASQSAGHGCSAAESPLAVDMALRKLVVQAASLAAAWVQEGSNQVNQGTNQDAYFWFVCLAAEFGGMPALCALWLSFCASALHNEEHLTITPPNSRSLAYMAGE